MPKRADFRKIRPDVLINYSTFIKIKATNASAIPAMHFKVSMISYVKEAESLH